MAALPASSIEQRKELFLIKGPQRKIMIERMSVVVIIYHYIQTIPNFGSFQE